MEYFLKKQYRYNADNNKIFQVLGRNTHKSYKINGIICQIKVVYWTKLYAKMSEYIIILRKMQVHNCKYMVEYVKCAQIIASNLYDIIIPILTLMC